jgi:hypothetical protein
MRRRLKREFNGSCLLRSHVQAMTSGPFENDRTIRLSTRLFLLIELIVYVALGILLSMTALLALVGVALLLLEGMRDWSGTGTIFPIVDRLMFALMLIEILHTVRGSVRSRAVPGHRADRFDTKCPRHHLEVIGRDLREPRLNPGRDIVPLLDRGAGRAGGTYPDLRRFDLSASAGLRPEGRQRG